MIHLIDGSVCSNICRQGAKSNTISRTIDQLMASTNAVEGIELG
jgi:hypothetical protein